jgi:hypothetical protein
MCRSWATGFGGATGSAGFAAAAAGAAGRAGGLAGAFGGAFVCGAAGFGAGLGAVCACSGEPLNTTADEKINAKTMLQRDVQGVMRLSLNQKRITVPGASE